MALILLGMPPCHASSIQFQDANANPDSSYAAELVVGIPCAAGDAEIPPGAIATNPAQIPCGALSADDVDIVSGVVRFQAGEEIALGEGFSVAAEATFMAEIGGRILGDAYLIDESPDAEAEYFARFYIAPDGLTLTEASHQFEHFVGYDDEGNREFALGLTYNPGLDERRLFTTAYDDSGMSFTTQGLCEQVLSAGWHHIEVHWRASSGLGGDVEVSINGEVFQSLSVCLSLGGGLDNSSGEISRVEWGARNISDGELGSMYLDDFESRAFGPIGDR